MMDHRDLLKSNKNKRSFGIKLAKKPHKRWPESLHNLRVKFNNVDIDDVELSKLNLYGSKDNPLYPKRKTLKASKNPFDDEDIEDVRKRVETLDSVPEDEFTINQYRRAHILCDFESVKYDIDICMPTLSSITVTVTGMQKLTDIKLEAILQAKRFPEQDDLSETTRYVFWYYERSGDKVEVYDEERTIGSLDMLVPVLHLREPDGHKIETAHNEHIGNIVGMTVTTLEALLDDEALRFRSVLFDSIQEAEKLRQGYGLNHYAFPEETVLQSFETSIKPEGSTEIFECDLDKMQNSENIGESEERVVEKLKRKIEASASVAQIWYRPNETDDYTYFTQIGRDVIEKTPTEVIDIALNYLKKREGVEIKEKTDDFILQVAGKDSFITRDIPLKRFEYIRSCFENYKVPILLLRLKKVIIPKYSKPEPIFVPAFMQAERKIKQERETIEFERLKRKVTESNDTRKFKVKKKFVPKTPPSTVVMDIEDIPESQPINFWDIEDDLKLRILSASHLIITGIEKLYVKVAVCAGNNVLQQKDSSIVHPSNPRWANCLLDFGLYIKDVPKSAHLSFSLMSEKIKKNTSVSTPIGFVNLRLFDWDDYLLQGKRTIFFWPFPKDVDDILNPTGINGTRNDQPIARLEIELTEFGNFVRYPSFESVMQYVKIMRQRRARNRVNEEELPSIDDFNEGSENVNRIIDLRKTIDPRNLNIEEQNFIWRARRKISSNFPSMLPIVVDLPIVWKTREMFCEMYGMLQDWPLLQVDAAMEMLDGKVTDTWIRNAAVERIDKALDNDQFLLYLLPLVQALRYEPFANSGLSKMLVKRGLLNYRIGHTLFWLLRAELNYYDLPAPIIKLPKFYVRCVLCLEGYLRGNAPHLLDIVKQVQFVNILTELSTVVKNVNVKESTTKVLQQELYQRIEKLQHMTSPLNPVDKLGDLLINRCVVLSSAKQPLKLTWKNPEPLSKLTSDTHEIIFKNGDDLRQDLLTLQVMRIMDAKWKLHNMDFCLTLYEVLPMGRNIGMIHVVQDCQTLFQIQTTSNQVGSSFTMDSSLFNRYLYQCSSDSKQYLESVDRFVSSVAGYCIITYVLGIKDRHQDNIMLANDGRLFHIDFGHFLGHTKKKLGINRERTEFVLTDHFLHIITRGKSNFKDTYEYKSFRESCLRGFMVLYNDARFFIALFKMMLCMGLPELSKLSHVSYLDKSLMYGKITDKAKKEFLQIFDGVVKSDWAISVNWFFHSIKHL